MFLFLISVRIAGDVEVVHERDQTYLSWRGPLEVKHDNLNNPSDLPFPLLIEVLNASG